ncbi:MAG: hypothetical protein CSA22_02380 [Deltaproteobacteria bacterium]|nr:MAG: hypothetical protein CSA22_02380 [Deltaproteobacteria bacterium]
MRIIVTFCLSMMLLVSGCAVQQKPSPPTHPSSRPPMPRPPATGRSAVSDHLIATGKQQLAQGHVQDAIVTLEQALGLSPQSGAACFYLAEAWIREKKADTARQYHRLAQRYLPATRSWKKVLAAQQKKIDQLFP